MKTKHVFYAKPSKVLFTSVNMKKKKKGKGKGKREKKNKTCSGASRAKHMEVNSWSQTHWGTVASLGTRAPGRGGKIYSLSPHSGSGKIRVIVPLKGIRTVLLSVTFPNHFRIQKYSRFKILLMIWAFEFLVYCRCRSIKGDYSIHESFLVTISQQPSLSAGSYLK